ncbi:MAG: hypothetical protein JXR10_16060 [Cyclobacteriaceae bacterium]
MIRKNIEEEVDLMALIGIIWQNRKLSLWITGSFLFLGLIISLTSKTEYEASCKLMPEIQEGTTPNLGGLGSLAGLAGVNLGLGVSGSLTPQLYPEIAKSVPFQLGLLQNQVYFQNLDTVMSSQYYFKTVDKPSLMGLMISYTIGLPARIRSVMKGNERATNNRESSLLLINKEDWRILEKFRDRIEVSVNVETGIITINTEMPDPYAAASLTDLIVEKLTAEITSYKIEKATVNYDFVRERYEEAKGDYNKKQTRLARYADQNKNINSSLIEIEYSRIKNEVDIAFEVYKGLANQLEQAKIKIKETTPIFTILEPVRVPVEKSKPKRIVILFVFGFIGFSVSVLYILMDTFILK